MRKLLALLVLALSLPLHALTIGAYNIRNFDYDQRYRIQTNKPALLTILTALKVDVLSVEEINNTAEFEKFIATKMPGYDSELSRCGGTHGQRLGFIYNKQKVDLLSFNEDLSISEPGTPGACDAGSRPLAIALFQIKATKQRFYGITAHLKSGSDPQSVAKRQKQYEIIAKVVNELRTKTGVKDFYIAGDMNTTEYLSRGSDFVAFNNLVKSLGMVSLTDRLGCSAYWWGGTDDGIETPSLLDHVIVTPGLIKNSGAKAKAGGHCQKVNCREVPIADLGISYEGVSDHCPITATIQ
jgi:endonuclease/exonuclease/phosphatase family metal-dependent hydrolase